MNSFAPKIESKYQSAIKERVRQLIVLENKLRQFTSIFSFNAPFLEPSSPPPLTLQKKNARKVKDTKLPERIRSQFRELQFPTLSSILCYPSTSQLDVSLFTLFLQY